MVYVWIGLTFLFVIIEAVSFQMLSLWFAAGSVAALFAAIFDAAPVVQASIFVGVSGLLLLLFRPIAKRLTKKAPIESTNSDRYIGETAVVLEDIDNIKNVGLVKVLGSVWSARSLNGECIHKDECVVVNSISGVKLIVSKDT